VSASRCAATWPGIWSAHRGTYRVLYRLDEEKREVIVVRIEHRRDAYRPR
jgi:mRNA-degrading endonuclease RelE of RelBE toxin-antitoxin system